MKPSRFTESQIIQATKEFEIGKPAVDMCRELGTIGTTLYKCRREYSGMDVNLLGRYKELTRENQKLKRMYADQSLNHRI